MPALIAPAELAAAHACGPVPVLVDVQYNLAGPAGRELYAAAHLPGARFLDVERDLAGPPGPRGRHPLPDLAALAQTLRRLGIDDSSDIVVYDQGTGLGAARAWWLLSYVGLRAVRVLDGGLAAWKRAGLPVTTIVPSPAPEGSVTVQAGAVPLLDAQGAQRLAGTGLLLDARARERFEGRVEPIDPVAGHIPGARSAPLSEFTDSEGRLLDREALHAYFADQGVFEHAQVGAYCGSGITAAALALALKQIGVTAAVYVGSWSEWITDPDRPIATGPEGSTRG